MRVDRTLRFLAPNLITASGIVFGLLAVVATHEHRYAAAGWWIIYAVLTDRLDGLVARMVRGTSDLGVQLDSFADFLTFGLAPAFLIFVSLGSAPGLPFTGGVGRAVLTVAAAAWVLAAVFRLARFNITSPAAPPGSPKIFFGVPTTLAAGVLVMWYLALLKYSPADAPLAAPGAFREPHLLGGLETPAGVWRYLPIVMLIGAFLMVSNLRMPKLGTMRNRPLTVFVMGNVLLGYLCGFARVFPEYMVWPPTAWLVIFLVWGQLSPLTRDLSPPAIFPAVDPPAPSPVRAEELLMPDEPEPEDRDKATAEREA